MFRSAANRCLARSAQFGGRFSATYATQSSFTAALDTYGLVRKLEGEGLSRHKAETLAEMLNFVVRDQFDAFSSNFSALDDLERFRSTHRIEMAELHGELLHATQSNLATLRETSSKLTEELERVRNQLADDLSNTAYTANREAEFVKSDITREVHEQDDKIQEAVGKVKTEIYFLNAQLEGLKFDIAKYIIGTMTTMAMLILGLYRMLKTG